MLSGHPGCLGNQPRLVGKSAYVAGNVEAYVRWSVMQVRGHEGTSGTASISRSESQQQSSA
eukprot:3960357-Prymnesium_polylepis.1